MTDNELNYELLSDGYANWPVDGNIPDDERRDIVRTLLALTNLIATPSRYPDKRFGAYLKAAFGDEIGKLRISDIDEIRHGAMNLLLKRVIDFYESGKSIMLFEQIRDWEMRDK